MLIVSQFSATLLHFPAVISYCILFPHEQSLDVASADCLATSQRFC